MQDFESIIPDELWERLISLTNDKTSYNQTSLIYIKDLMKLTEKIMIRKTNLLIDHGSNETIDSLFIDRDGLIERLFEMSNFHPNNIDKYHTFVELALYILYNLPIEYS
ncbi:MAG: hypothetical protein OEY49_12575 [Candidatus Heimdallarchaeota archaeon]|nr:hypothetical protein [Candidatus Heimdallarchaeota archaeon]